MTDNEPTPSADDDLDPNELALQMAPLGKMLADGLKSAGDSGMQREIIVRTIADILGQMFFVPMIRGMLLYGVKLDLVKRMLERALASAVREIKGANEKASAAFHGSTPEDARRRSSATVLDEEVALTLKRRPWMMAQEWSIWQVTGTYVGEDRGTFVRCLVVALPHSVTGGSVLFKMIGPLEDVITPDEIAHGIEFKLVRAEES